MAFCDAMTAAHTMRCPALRPLATCGKRIAAFRAHSHQWIPGTARPQLWPGRASTARLFATDSEWSTRKVDLSSKDYWQNHYAELAREGQSNGVFEWFMPSEKLVSTLAELSRTFVPQPRVLELGCGTSLLSERLCREPGIRSVTAIDYSPLAIDILNRRRDEDGSTPRPSYQVMDATQLTFPAGSFDAVVDKGTLDAMLHTPDKAAAVLREVLRVLARPGVYLQISDEPPELRADMVHGLLQRSRTAGDATTSPVISYRELEGGDSGGGYFLYTISIPAS